MSHLLVVHLLIKCFVEIEGCFQGLFFGIIDCDACHWIFIIFFKFLKHFNLHNGLFLWDFIGWHDNGFLVFFFFFFNMILSLVELNFQVRVFYFKFVKHFLKIYYFFLIFNHPLLKQVKDFLLFLILFLWFLELALKFLDVLLVLIHQLVGDLAFLLHFLLINYFFLLQLFLNLF